MGCYDMLKMLHWLGAVTRARACTVGLQTPEQGLKVKRNLSQLCPKPIQIVIAVAHHAILAGLSYMAAIRLSPHTSGTSAVLGVGKSRFGPQWRLVMARDRYCIVNTCSGSSSWKWLVAACRLKASSTMFRNHTAQSGRQPARTLRLKERLGQAPHWLN